MASITRNVSDIAAGDIPALEHLIGVPLLPSQQVIVQVVEKPGLSDTSSHPSEPQLPDYFNVYEGLSDEEIDRLEEGFVRLNLRRDNLFEETP